MTVQEALVAYVVLLTMYAAGALVLWLLSRTWWVPKGPIQRLYLFRWESVMSIYIHRIPRPDVDRDLHNHPWKWAKSFVLRGGYKEQRLTRTGRIISKWVMAGDSNRLDDNTYHRIDIILPDTLTLFIAGPRNKSWGFLTPEGEHIDWKAYKNA